MKEIKFRAWDKATNKGWIPSPIKELIYFGVHHPPEYIGNTYNEKGTWERRFEIMQYTGLKDKNNTEIYEGDILGEADDTPVFVQYSEEDAAFVFVDIFEQFGTTVYTADDISYECLEVLGNIYEHPHLLEVAE